MNKKLPGLARDFLKCKQNELFLQRRRCFIPRKDLLDLALIVSRAQIIDAGNEENGWDRCCKTCLPYPAEKNGIFNFSSL